MNNTLFPLIYSLILDSSVCIDNNIRHSKNLLQFADHRLKNRVSATFNLKLPRASLANNGKTETILDSETNILKGDLVTPPSAVEGDAGLSPDTTIDTSKVESSNIDVPVNSEDLVSSPALEQNNINVPDNITKAEPLDSNSNPHS